MASVIDLPAPTEHAQPADAVQNAVRAKVNLLGMSRAELEGFFEQLGEKVSCRTSDEVDSSVFCH